MTRTVWYRRAKHAEPVAALLAECCPPRRWSESAVDSFLAEKTGRLIKVAEDGGLPVGAVLYTLPVSRKGVCTIHHLAVSPAHRGRGTARALLDAVMSRRVGVAFAEAAAPVDARDLPAQQFMRHMGFRVDPKRNNRPGRLVFRSRAGATRPPEARNEHTVRSADT